jgi:dephospho-CoA kinase
MVERSSREKTPSPPIIGIVGGVGSGKSTVAGMLRDLGCVVADSDQYARDALRDPVIKPQLIDWWSRDILDGESGEVDRKKVATIVFAEPAQRRRLESLTHPWIERRRRAVFAAAPAEAKALVIDAPLLLEAGLAKECDAILFIDAPPDVRSRRVTDNRGWSQSQWNAREAAQMPLDEKRQMADHVVVNGGDLNDLRVTVARTLDQIIAGHGQRPNRRASRRE